MEVCKDVEFRNGEMGWMIVWSKIGIVSINLSIRMIFLFYLFLFYLFILYKISTVELFSTV